MQLNIQKPFEKFAGSIAVVTGAGGGIGRTVTQLLSTLDIKVLAVDKNERSLSFLEESEHFANVTPLVADVSISDGIRKVEELADSTEGDVSLWLNNAGIVSRAPLAEMTVVDWDEIMAVNLRSVFLGCQAAHRLMKGQDSGSIINIASMSSSRVQKFRTAYAASKSSIMNLTKNLAVEWGNTGIRVNAIAPGFVLTPMSNWHILDDNGRKELTASIPMGKLADPIDIAYMVLLLASPLTGYVTGEVIHVDGGWSL